MKAGLSSGKYMVNIQIDPLILWSEQIVNFKQLSAFLYFLNIDGVDLLIIRCRFLLI
jgi:hypothetical protein